MKKAIKKKGNERAVRLAILILALAFVFIFVYSPHFSNPYPIHIDEWQHIAQIISVSEGKANWNPYFREGHADLEIFFHGFWALFALLLGRQGFIMFCSFLPAVFAVLSGLMLFILVKRITKRFSAALFSVLLFGSLKSSLNIIGIAYFTPLSMAIPLMFLFMLLFIEGISENNRKKLLLSAASFAALLLIHPPSATILLPVVIFYPVVCRKFFSKNRKAILVSLSALALVFAASFFIKIGGRAASEILISNLVFRLGWTGYELKYFLPFLFSIPATLLAVFGAYRSFDDEKSRFFLIFALFTIAISMVFNRFNISILAPYQRVIYYSMISLVPLAAIGLSELYTLIKSQLERKWSSIYPAMLSAATALLILALVFTSKYPSADSVSTDYASPVLSGSSERALLWVSENYPKDYVVMAPVFTTSAVYPVSGNLVQSLLPAQLGTFDRQDERISDALSFYNSTNCSEQISILDKWNVSIVLSSSEIRCFSPEFSSGLAGSEFALAYDKGYFVYARKEI